MQATIGTKEVGYVERTEGVLHEGVARWPEVWLLRTDYRCLVGDNAARQLSLSPASDI